MPTVRQNDVRNLEPGVLLLGIGAVLLLVSLFLEWYQPNIDAWEIFEVWDLVLALLAIGALVAFASRLGYGAPRPASHVFGPGIAALVIVLYSLLNPPPLSRGLGDGDPGVGLWLALAATILMAVGALLSVARVSVAFTRDPTAPSPAAPVADPVAGPGVAPPHASPRTGARVLGDPRPPAADPTDPVPPTDPTRRL